MTNGMKITKGPKQTRPVPNFFDDEVGATHRELLFDGKRYSELTPAEHEQAVKASERKRRSDRGAWMFVAGLVVFCWLLSRF